ncbi:MAG: thioredoxin domain-containing protein [Patescibacteria group bacterium]|jgi:protein-disulfide isomerase
MSEEIRSTEKLGFLDGNPRTMFTFGVVSGMAIILLLNNFVGLSSGTALAKTDTAPTVVAADTVAEAAPVAGKLAPATSADHVRGDLSKAKVVLVEYSDFQCPYCSKHQPTMEQIMSEYGDDVAWVYRHFPLSFHSNAQSSSLASECAGEQGKFWEFADAMFDGQTSLSTTAEVAETFMTATAKKIGLDMTKYNDCIETAKYQSAIDDDAASGKTAGVSGTPATFINGTLVSGAVPFASMKKIVDEAIANAK